MLRRPWQTAVQGARDRTRTEPRLPHHADPLGDGDVRGVDGGSVRLGLPTRLAGKLPHGGVSERPKEHASKACDG